jgi:hypothetical protein
MIKEQFLMMSVVMGLFAQTQCGIIHVHEPVEGSLKAWKCFMLLWRFCYLKWYANG